LIRGGAERRFKIIKFWEVVVEDDKVEELGMNGCLNLIKGWETELLEFIIGNLIVVREFIDEEGAIFGNQIELLQKSNWTYGSIKVWEDEKIKIVTCQGVRPTNDK